MAWPIAYFRDDFEDNTIAAAWTAAVLSGSATVAETGGQAKFTLPSSTAGTHEERYTSNAQYDLTGDQAAVSIGTMVATGVAATAYFSLLVDANNGVRWIQASGTLKAQKIIAGAITDLFSVAWSSSTHKYLRIRESGGTIFFDTSTSASAGAAWTNRASVTTALSVPVTALSVLLGAFCGNVASPGSLQLDMFNLVLPTPTRTWRWTDADWGITNRIRPITLASSGNKQGVIVTAGGKDASNNLTGTIRYFAGPVGSASGGYNALTEYASLAAAQGNPFDIPTDGRVDLPALVDARLVRLYHSSKDGASGTLREFVPRRMIQADDIEAESIKAINIAASTITADKIAVLALDASHYITAGGGAVTLNDQGIVIQGATSYLTNRAYGFTDGTNRTADLFSIEAAATHYLQAYAYQVAGKDTQILISADAPTGKVSVVRLTARVNSVATAEIQLSGNSGVSITTGDFSVNTGGVNVGTTGAAAGQVKTASRVIIDAGLNASVLEVHNTDALGGLRAFVFSGEPGFAYTNGGFGYNYGPLTGGSSGRVDTSSGGAVLRFNSAGAATLVSLDSAGTSVTIFTSDITSSAPRIGFLGAGAVARQTGGAATAGASYTATEQGMVNRMYTALRNYGLLT